jgi:hypothetical protein
LTLESIILLETSHSQKTNAVLFHLHEELRVKLQRQKVEQLLPSTGKKKECREMFNGFTASVLQDENFWRLMVVMATQQYEST